MSRASIASPTRRARSSPSAHALTGDYLEISRRPFPSLVFLLPLIAAYEIGTIAFARDAATGAETRIIAFTMLSRFLSYFGATGRFLPALAVVGILLAVHITQRDSWRFPPKVLGWMGLESLCWAIPLLGIGLAVARYSALSAQSGASLPASIVLSLGAGIYEELVFRLIAFALCSFVLSDLMGLKPRPTAVITLVVAAATFSLYHYLGSEHAQWRTFVFRTLAGIFFGALYLTRGFGVTSGTHAAYDVIVHLLRG